MKNRILVKLRVGHGGLELENHPVSPVGPTDALIKIQRAAICGTDLHIYRWNAWASRTYELPLALGHEFVGEVLEIGRNVKSVAVGQKVVAETHIPCGLCLQCRNNRRHTCLNLGLLSKLSSGCIAEFTVLPAAVLRLVPAAISLEHACVMEPLGLATRAVMETDPRTGTLLVVGCGPVGLFVIVAAKALGAAKVLASDVSEFRLNLARQVGADVVMDVRTVALKEVVRAATQGDMVDVAIDTSGNQAAIAEALPLVSPGGRLLILGLPDAPVSLDIARDVVLREVSIRGLYGRLLDETWIQVERLLLSRAIPLDPVLTHTFGLEEYAKAFDLADTGAAGKILFAP